MSFSKDKKNAAVCISGHLRNYYQIKNNFYNFINSLREKYDVDVFVATWNKLNTSNSWSFAHGISDPNTVNKFVSMDEVKEHYNTDHVKIFDYDFYSSDFSPLNYKKNTDSEYNWDSRGIGDNVVNSSKMFFLMYQSNLLKSEQEFINQKKYDLVFRIRPDFQFFNVSFLNIEEILENCIYTNFQRKMTYGEGIYDIFAFGDSLSMDKYNSTFLKHFAVFNFGIWGDPENVLAKSLSFHKLKGFNIGDVGYLGGDMKNSIR